MSAVQDNDEAEQRAAEMVAAILQDLASASADDPKRALLISCAAEKAVVLLRRMHGITFKEADICCTAVFGRIDLANVIAARQRL